MCDTLMVTISLSKHTPSIKRLSVMMDRMIALLPIKAHVNKISSMFENLRKKT